MADYSLDTIKSVPNADSSNTSLNIVSAARNGVCGLYRAKPWALFGVPGPDTDMSPQSQSFRQFMDGLCDDGPLPPMLPPTLGGKCAIPYDVTFRFSGDPDQGSPFVTTDTRRVTGPIGSVQLRTNPTNSSLWQFYFTAGVSNSIIVIGSFQKAESNAGGFSAGITGIVAVNPALDVCGGTDPGFPVQPVGPGDYSPPVQYRDRGTNVTVNVNIPPIVIPPGAVSVAPKFDVKIGPNRVTFDLSGGTLKIEPSLEIPITIGGGSSGENPNAPVTVGPGLDGELLADRFDRIEDLLEELEECACSDDPPGTLTVTVGTAAASQCVSVPTARNRFCAIAISQTPTNRKSQSGGSAPDVLYAGWAWFKTGDYMFERSPIDSAGKIFANPGGAEAFCYTMNAGFIGTPLILDRPNA